MKEKGYVIGIDFGTDSVRALLVDASDGSEISTHIYHYRLWKSGLYCDPVNNRFRQHPLDYIEGLEEVVTGCLKKAPKEAARNVAGISVDTTGSTPCAVDRRGMPLALRSEFNDNPNAMFVLWKDHSAVKEADEINHLAKTWGGTDYTKYSGGVYSSEWFWAKLLHVIRTDSSVREAACSWIEHCDWIPALLTGCSDAASVKRSRCAAGHKAMWHESFHGLPHRDFLVKLDPLLDEIRGRLYRDTYTSCEKAGSLSPVWAKRLGIGGREVAVGVGAFDAHMGAVGGGIRPYVLSKVMGTSTCDMLIAPLDDIGDKLIRGICGQVDGSIVPGMMGMEAGQSAFGDIYAWFQQLLAWPLLHVIGKADTDERKRENITGKAEDRIIPELSRQAAALPVDESIIAIDWMNGRRTPYANQLVKGAIAGLNLGSDAPRIFRALVESTAFGAKKIVDRFHEEGIEIKEVIALGGVAKKSPFIMQVVADVLGKKIKVAASEQACALGAAMFAAVAAGIHKDIETAQAAMESGFEKEYVPDPDRNRQYERLYEKYSAFCAFIETQTGRLDE
ncbi:MAG: ribulokinase [Spirochaetales bacterium]|nr:ribulokinase [Spirochaetales bacterium]